MKYFIPFCLIIFTACNNQYAEQQNTNTGNKDSVVTVVEDAVSETRANVSTKPVASFSKKVPDELNDWKFAVNIYETTETFHYLMKMQYMELTADDTLKIPNFGIEPKIEVKEGPDKFSCIVGFLDKQNAFKEYKLVSAKDGSLSVKILHRYATVTYDK